MLFGRFLTRFIDILLPRHKEVLRFDTLPISALARESHTVVFHKQVDCYAPLRYASPLVRSCVHAAKYYAHERAVHMLGKSLAPLVADILAEQLLFGLFEHPLIIPVPLHESRQRERGYNQAEKIAWVVAKLASTETLRCRIDVLVRSRNTNAQARLDKKQRKRNMVGAFTVALPDAVRGADIVLIDDVVTTGATLHAARTTLLKDGARTVLCFAVAH